MTLCFLILNDATKYQTNYHSCPEVGPSIIAFVNLFVLFQNGANSENQVARKCTSICTMFFLPTNYIAIDTLVPICVCMECSSIYGIYNELL